MSSARQRDIPRSRTFFYVLFPALLAVITVMVWSSCLQFGFVYDDHAQIEINPRIQSFSYVGNLISEPLWAQLGASRASHYYRPLFSLLLLAEYALFGLTASFWHAVSLALYVLSVLAVYLLLFLLFDRMLAAFAGSLVFALLPVHTELVSWVSAVDESLFSVLLILALCALILANRASKPRHSTYWLVLSGVLFGLSLFSKENAIFAGLILISYQWILGQRKKGGMGRAWLIFAVPLTLYLGSRLLVMDGSILSVPRRSAGAVLSLLPGLARLSILQLTGLGPISSFYDSTTSPGYWARAGAAILPCAAVVGCVLLIKKAPAAGWALTLFLLPLVSWGAGLFYLSEYALFQNRYLFLPSVAIAVLIAYGLRTLDGRGLILVTAAICLLVGPPLAFADYQAMSPYHDDLVMYQQAVRIAPQNVVAIGLLAETTSRTGDAAAAVNLYRRAVELRPDLWETNFHLAMEYLRSSQKDKAEDSLVRSIGAPVGIQGERALSWFEVGRLRSSRGDLAGAAEAFQTAEKLQPSSRRVRKELVVLLTRAGRTQDATIERFKLSQLGSGQEIGAADESAEQSR